MFILEMHGIYHVYMNQNISASYIQCLYMEYKCHIHVVSNISKFCDPYSY